MTSAARDPYRVTVLTVDDQAVFRRVARDLVSATPGFVHAGEAASGRQALRLADELDPDLVLLDVRMPDMDGIETARRLAAKHPRAVIVLVSVDDLAAQAGATACPAAAHLRKRDLSTRSLQQVWRAHAPEAHPAA